MLFNICISDSWNQNLENKSSLRCFLGAGNVEVIGDPFFEVCAHAVSIPQCFVDIVEDVVGEVPMLDAPR